MTAREGETAICVHFCDDDDDQWGKCQKMYYGGTVNNFGILVPKNEQILDKIHKAWKSAIIENLLALMMS